MFDDQTYDIDERIKYTRGEPGAHSGELRVDFTYQGKRVTKSVRWTYPHQTEESAIHQLMNFLRMYPKFE